MKLVGRVAELRAARADWGRVGRVPTMGFLHDGHLSLLRAARAVNETVVNSLCVNPTQFAPSDVFASYPRDTPRDLELAAASDVDVVFMPSEYDVYPPGFDTWVEVGALASRWEGEYRHGHFRGVTTVVMKLFQMIQPDAAYFGEKDYQQLVVVKKMVADLNLPLEIVACPTVREPSGLALSSRNAYLSVERRRAASILYRAMLRAQELASSGVSESSVLLAEMQEVLAQEFAADLDYLAIVDRESLEPLDRVVSQARMVGALRFDGVRLIDNLELTLRSA